MNRFFNFFRRHPDRGKPIGSNFNRGAEDSVTPTMDISSFEKIALQRVAYVDSERDDLGSIFGPVDLDFYPGELVFVIGSNGAGKTTLAKLICGIYQPSVGEIVLNNDLITDANRSAYRQHFSGVMSGLHPVETSRLRSISDADRSTVERLLILFNLSLQVSLSGAEFTSVALNNRQASRLRLIQAYLEDKPAYVFDEWTVGHNHQHREAFYWQLLPELKARGKLILVVSQDERYYHLADRLIKLEDCLVTSDERMS